MGVPALPLRCGPLEGLLGTWQGRGVGHHPTIEPFPEEAHSCDLVADLRRADR